MKFNPQFHLDHRMLNSTIILLVVIHFRVDVLSGVIATSVLNFLPMILSLATTILLATAGLIFAGDTARASWLKYCTQAVLRIVSLFEADKPKKGDKST